MTPVRAIQQIEIKVQELIDKNILPSARDRWRPEAWRIFVQAVTRRRGANAEFDGVPSALAALTIRLRFRPSASVAAAKARASKKPATNGAKDCTPVILTPLEERRLGLLEWLPLPIRFNLLPPEDQSLRAGYALVPMPAIPDSGTTNVTGTYPLTSPISGELPGLLYEPHPERIRALQMTWNQGPSSQIDHPLELHAKYQLLQFDADATPAERLEFPDGKPRDFLEWAGASSMRVVQEVELMPKDDVALNPADTSKPIAWDLWTAVTSRRIALRRTMIAAGTWPETTDKTRLGPWYSWRDSYLVWPSVEDDYPALEAGGIPKPPEYDPITQRLWPFHAALRMALAYIANIPESVAKPGTPLPLASYTIEIGRGPARGDTKGKLSESSAPGGGLKVNEIPPAKDDKTDRPTPLAAFLAANAPATDPHGWGILTEWAWR